MDVELTTKPLILIVEDHNATQFYVTTVLRREFDTLLADNGAEVRAQLAAHPDIEIVLMDLSLKGDEDGLQITRWLRADSRWQNVPIIATTAYAMVEDERAALAAGCTIFLPKPISPRDLIEAVRTALASRHVSTS